MSMEKYDEESLAAAFDYLVDYENQAKGFKVKNNNLRRLWLEKLEMELYMLVECFYVLGRMNSFFRTILSYRMNYLL